MRKTIRVVLDTNILYAGLYSSKGASFKLLQAIEKDRLKMVLSTTLLFEYEDVLKRYKSVLGLSDPRTAIESCHCERSEAISHYRTEIAAHPTGTRNDGKNRVVAKSIAVLGSDGEIDKLLDYFCLKSEHQKIHFLWRPQLPDTKDDHILELAVASGTSIIVTYNAKDFKEIASFGVRSITPKELMEEIV